MTLAEISISLVLLSVLSAMVFSLVNTFNRINYEQMLMEDLKEQSQHAIRNIDRNLIRAKRFFPRGTGYLNLIPWDSIPPPVGWCVDPKIAPVGVVNPDSPKFDRSIFGNRLFFAKIENSATITAGGKTYDINLYRFIIYYLSPDSTHSSRPYPYSVRLVRWESETFADFWDLKHIWSDSTLHNLTQIKSALINQVKVSHCWDTAESDPTKAFYSIGSFTSPASINFHTNSTMILITSINVALGVAFNKSTDYPLPIEVPCFAGQSGDSPGGLEIAITGSASSRLVLIRLVSAGWTRNRLIAYETITTVSSPEY